MVWFYCNDCGDSIKKPKVPAHCSQCSASSFTCIDCSRTFDRCTVKMHSTCVTEHEKYALCATKPGGYAQNGFYSGASEGAAKPANMEIVGHEFLSTRYPWKCSLCNVSCTSEETLLGHAAGTKHSRRARAALAARATGDVSTTNQQPFTDRSDSLPSAVMPSPSAKSLPMPGGLGNNQDAAISEAKDPSQQKKKLKEVPTMKESAPSEKPLTNTKNGNDVHETVGRKKKGNKQKSEHVIDDGTLASGDNGQHSAISRIQKKNKKRKGGDEDGAGQVAGDCHAVSSTQCSKKANGNSKGKQSSLEKEQVLASDKGRDGSMVASGTEAGVEVKAADKFKWKSLAVQQLKALGGVVKRSGLRKKLLKSIGLPWKGQQAEVLGSKIFAKLQKSSKFKFEGDTVVLVA